MNLSLRARLTLWYGLVLLAVLLVAGVGVVWLHSTLSVARVDSQLRDAAATVTALVRAEFEEADREAGSERALSGRAQEALKDLELPGTGVAILSRDGSVLTTRVFGVPTLPQGGLTSAVAPAGFASHQGLRIHQQIQHSQPEDFQVVTWISLAGYEREHATLVRALWLGVPLALLAATIGGWIVGRHGLRPLTAMARQAETITADRPDGRLWQSPRRDELAQLASAFNALLDRLAGALRVQRQFMADASHQLRTPVSIARTAAQVTLSAPQRTDEEYREALAVVATQTRRLTEMIERMFTLALADVNARPLQLSDFYLDELVHECAGAAGILAAERRLIVRADSPREVPFRGDEGLLRQMIMNLVENAVRHTPPQGTVDLSLSARNGEVRIAVCDAGGGIPPADQTRIFERFVRLETAESAGGGGLGLPIARWVAEAHRGSLRLESSSAAGSCFVVTLPSGPV